MVTTQQCKPALRFKDEQGKDYPDWKIIALGDTRSSQRHSFTGGPFGSNLKNEEYTKEGIRIVQLQNIGDGIFIDDYKIFTSSTKADQLKSCNIYPSEIIISKMGDPVARACLIPSNKDERYLMASDGIRLQVDPKKFDCKFIHDCINHSRFRKKAISHSTGSTRKRIGLTDLRKLKIFVPLLEEQQKIAAFLSSVDTRIEQLNRKKSLLEKYKQGMMQKLFSQEIRFKDEQGKKYPDWEEKSLNDISEVITKGTTPTSVGHKFIDVGINFIKAEHITKSGVIKTDDTPKISDKCDKLLRRSKLRNGDILFSIAGTLGRTAIIKEKDLPANTNQALSIIRLETHANIEFVYYFLNLSLIKKYIRKSLSIGAQPNLNLQQVGEIKICFPNLIEQQKITNFLSAIDKKLEFVTEQIKQAQTFKKGLLQQMFI